MSSTLGWVPVRPAVDDRGRSRRLPMAGPPRGRSSPCNAPRRLAACDARGAGGHRVLQHGRRRVGRHRWRHGLAVDGVVDEPDVKTVRDTDDVILGDGPSQITAMDLPAGRYHVSGKISIENTTSFDRDLSCTVHAGRERRRGGGRLDQPRRQAAIRAAVRRWVQRPVRAPRRRPGVVAMHR